MARGRRMSEQRRSARETMRRRERGDSRERSEGSSYNKSGGGASRARENRERAVQRDNEKRASEQLAKQQQAAAQKAADEAQRKKTAERIAKQEAAQKERERLAKQMKKNVDATQQRPTVASRDDITGESERQGYREGYTNKARAITSGNVVESALGGLAGGLTEKIVEKVGEANMEETDNRLRLGNRKTGATGASNRTVTGSRLGDGALEAGLDTLGPVGDVIRTGLVHDSLMDGQFAGVPAYEGNNSGGVRNPNGGSRNNDRGQGGGNSINTDSGAAEPATPARPASGNTPTTTVTYPRVDTINPGIGIAAGTHERAPNFSGSIVVRGNRAKRKRGRV